MTVFVFWFLLPYDATDSPLREVIIRGKDIIDARSSFYRVYPNAERVSHCKRK